MNLQDLIYFHHLAKNLSFTETASHFFVSQPSISTAVKRLETEFNATLIDRRKTLKKLKLTPAGEILQQNTDEILKTLKTTRKEIEDIELGSVYFGFLPTIGGHFLPKILPEMSRFTHSLKFIEEESSDVMLNLILNGEVPLAIIGHEDLYIKHNRLQQILLKEDEVALWVSKKHPLANESSVGPEDLQDEVFISLAERYTHSRIFEKWTANNQIKAPNIVYAKEIKTVQSMIASTKMVGFMSEILLAGRSDLVRVSLKEAPKFYISLVLNAEIENTYIQQQFNNAFIERVRELKKN